MISNGLLEDQVEQYRHDGFLFPVHVLSPAEAETAGQALQDVVRQCDIPMGRVPMLHEYFRWAYDLVAHPRILDVVEKILGPDLIVWGTLVLSKEPGSRSMVPWHQDRAYAGFLSGSPSVSVWIALTPVTSQNGCLRVIRASHGALLPFSNEKSADDMLRRGQRIVAKVNEADAVDIVLRPGEASLHDDTLIHGSNPNHSDGPRTGFIIRYATPAISQPQVSVFCVRGNPGSIHCHEETPAGNVENCYSKFAAYARLQNASKDSNG
jgi:ectoine hydroxylase-related dioxygenase (phytanoyl-CoA dioxygenase family)